MEKVKENGDIQHRAIKACLEWAGLTSEKAEGLELFHAADLPSRSGVGSSSAFIVGLLNALAAQQGRRLSPWELAETAIDIERNRMGEAVGLQDQTFAAYGGFNIISFERGGAIHVYPMVNKRERLTGLEELTMLFHTKIFRNASDVARSYVEKLGEGERQRAILTMLRLAEQSIQAIERENYERLGWLVDQSWRIKVSLSPEVCTPHISDLYFNARLNGAWGGKLMGAGGGGALFVIVPKNRQKEVENSLVERGCFRIHFKFSYEGSQIVFTSR